MNKLTKEKEHGTGRRAVGRGRVPAVVGVLAPDKADRPVNRRGPPFRVFDWDIFETACRAQCTREEIAGLFKCDPDTLSDAVKREYEEDYSSVYKKFSHDGMATLRVSQMKGAVNKENTTMQIWLGQQYLRQSQKNAISGLDPEAADKIIVEYDVRRRLYSGETVPAAPSPSAPTNPTLTNDAAKSNAVGLVSPQ